MRNKILYGILAFVIAFALWMYVVTVVNTTSDRTYNNISVSLEGESFLKERNLMVITKDIPEAILNLEGARTELDKLNSSNITLSLDVSKIYEEGNHKIYLSPSYPGDVSDNSLSVLEIKPQAINLEVVKAATKDVPVTVVYTGTLPESYIADKENKILDQETVTITGPESVVKTISVAQIEVDLTDRVENISEQFLYKLCKRNGTPVDAEFITTDVEAISLNLRIARIKEIPLMLTVVDGGGATKDNTEIKIEPESIGISGSDALLEGIENIELGTIDLNEIPRDTELTLPIKLPDGVINETGVSEARVTVQFPGLATKTLTVTNFKTVNVPKGYTAKLITQVLEVQIRGPQETIDTLESSELTALVDFKDAQSGMVKVKAEITSDIVDIGAVGTYTVSATVSERKGADIAS